MRPITPFALAALLAAAGCSRQATLSLATTPEKSRAVLTSSLDAWKSGRSQVDLTRQAPPVYFGDDQFGTGWTLVDYKLDGEPRVLGTGLSYKVVMTLRQPGRPAVTRTAGYRVVTEPNHCVTREDS